jgi:hypothetical protein
MGCSPSTITRLVQRITLTRSVNDRPRPGRRRVTSPNQDRLIQLRHLHNRFLTATQTAQHMQGIIGGPLPASTVQRRFRSMDLHSRQPFRGNNLEATESAAVDPTMSTMVAKAMGGTSIHE